MKNLLRFALLGTALGWLVGPAAAATVDFTGIGTSNFQVITADTWGDSADVDFTYSTLNGGNNWGQSASIASANVQYWNDTNYSGDNAIYSDGNGRKLQVSLQAGLGKALTFVKFNFGSFPNQNLSIDYKVFNDVWAEIFAGTGTTVFGNGGYSHTFIGFPTTSWTIQLGDNWNVGLTSIEYQVSNINAVPLPAALPLFAAGLASMAVYRRRKRKLT